MGYKNETAFSAETKIWGDGDCNNGFAPGTVCTSPAHDLLKSGQSIVLENTVEVGGAANGIKFDGGDKISATYPIAITRGAYPVDPGSLMAGGVEVLDTSEWGTFFVSPIGQDVDITNDPFEHTALYIMAKDDNTTINFSTGLTAVIHSGESYTFVVTKKGQTLTASSPVQVDLIVGDIGSTYELRWFSLLPHAAWSTSYLSPVGDSVGNTQIYMYNARPNTVTVKVTLMDGTNYTRSLNGTGSGWKFTDIIPTGSGALLEGTGDFIALSITDRLTADGGQRYDWGFPVLPLNKLTETVLIGWGYGCTNKNCYNKNDVGGLARSVVWVSPIEDADIYIDLNNDGVPEADRTVKGARRLSSNIFENGNDMSGATIWAVKPNENWDSMNSVGIAAAWGQNPLYSYNNQPLSLDLGMKVWTTYFSEICIATYGLTDFFTMHCRYPCPSLHWSSSRRDN